MWLDARVQTDTNCTFPLATVSGAPATDPSECVSTMAQVLNPGFDALSYTVMGVGAFTALVETYRLNRLRMYAAITKRAMNNIPSTAFHAFTLLFSLALVIETVDLYAFRGVVPFSVYTIEDEVVGFFLVGMGVSLADFLLRASKLRSDGFSVAAKWGMLVSCFVDMVGFAALQVARPDLYNGFECAKDLILSLLLAVMLSLAYRSVRSIVSTLLTSDGAHGNLTTVTEATRQAARLLVRKFRAFAVIICLAIIALVANAALSVSSGLPVFFTVSALDPTQAALKGIYCFACLAVVALFPSPSLSAASGGASNKSSTNSKGQGNAKVADGNTATSGTGSAWRAPSMRGLFASGSARAQTADAQPAQVSSFVAEEPQAPVAPWRPSGF